MAHAVRLRPYWALMKLYGPLLPCFHLPTPQGFRVLSLLYFAPGRHLALDRDEDAALAPEIVDRDRETVDRARGVGVSSSRIYWSIGMNNRAQKS